MIDSVENSESPNKPENLNHIFETWNANARWRDNLARKASHKSLDIPEDDMNIGNTTHNYNGPVTQGTTERPKRSGALVKTLIGGALVASGAGVGIGLPLLFDGGKDVIKETINNTTVETISPGFGQPD